MSIWTQKAHHKGDSISYPYPFPDMTSDGKPFDDGFFTRHWFFHHASILKGLG